MVDDQEQQTGNGGRWFTAVILPIAILFAAWVLPGRQPLLHDAVGKFQLVMVFVCPLAGVVSSFTGFRRYSGEGKTLLAVAGAGYSLLLAFILLIAMSPPWGPT